MAVKIYKVEPRVDYVIHVTFFNGVVNAIKIGEWAKVAPEFQELVSDRTLFDSVKVDKSRTSVSWDNGFSMSNEELYGSGVLVESVYIEDAAVRFGERLYAYRTASHMTQKELEEKSGIHQADISKFENGEGNPSVKTMERLAKGMGMELDISRGYFVQRHIVDVPMYAAAVPYLSPEKCQGEFVVKDLEGLPEDMRVELIDGVIYAMATPTVPHQEIISQIFYQVMKFINENHGSSRPFVSPISLFCDDERFYLEPDMVVVCNPDIIKKDGLHGAPDFVLEVISPSNTKRDLYDKLAIYHNIGVREYWVINPMKKYMIKYNLEQENPPELHFFNDTVSFDIYDGQLTIDLKEIDKIIDSYEE